MRTSYSRISGRFQVWPLLIFSAFFAVLSMATFATVQQKTTVITLAVNAQAQLQEVGQNVILKIRLAPSVTAQLWADNVCAQPKNNAVILTASGTYTIPVQNIKGSGEQFACLLSSDGKLQASISLRTTQAASTTAIASSLNPSLFGQSVTFTATVTDNSGSGGIPTGIVTFNDGGVTLGTGTLNASKLATFTTSALTTSAHSITAVYGGDANFFSSTSATLTQTVNKSPSAAALVPSVNPAVFGQSVTFTATLTANGGGAGTPTGTVTFKDGATTLGTGTLNGSGVAVYTTATLSIAAHSITAIYAGDANFATVTSPTLTETVNKSSSAATLISSVNPAVFGQSVTFTATLTATGGGAGTPTGTVTFKDGATTLGTGTLNGSGVAAYTTATVSIAAHSITAVYAGDANFAIVTSPTLTQTINKSSTSTALSSSANNPSAGQSITFTAAITATGGGSGTPTGTVTFKDGTSTLGTGALNASGTATFNTGSLAAGTHSITAVYGGDARFLTSTSSVLSQKVK